MLLISVLSNLLGLPGFIGLRVYLYWLACNMEIVWVHIIWTCMFECDGVRQLMNRESSVRYFLMVLVLLMCVLDNLLGLQGFMWLRVYLC